MILHASLREKSIMILSDSSFMKITIVLYDDSLLH